MGIICFRYAAGRGLAADELDELNQKISQTAIEENLAAPLTTRLLGKLVLRICSIHPGLTDAEMVSVVEGLDRIATALVAQSPSSGHKSSENL